MEKNKNNNFYFELFGKCINLSDYIKDFKNNINIKKDKKIIYIKQNDNKENFKIRTKKYYDYHINYNDINEESYIKVSINISDKEKSKLKDSLEDINKYILSIIGDINDIHIKPLYIENPNKNNKNKITFICNFTPDFVTKRHRIYEIEEYMIKLLWNKEKFPYEKVKNNFTDLSNFKKILIDINKRNQKLKIYPDFEPVIILEKKDNDIFIKLQYNIRQIYFVKPAIIPDPIV